MDLGSTRVPPPVRLAIELCIMAPKVSWKSAFRLTERACIAAEHCPLPLPEEREAAKQRFETWRSQAPFEQEEWFRQRLLQGGLTEKEFLYLIGLTGASLDRLVQSAPEWGERLKQVYSQGTGSKSSQSVDSEGFMPLIGPLVQDTLRKLHEAAEELKRQFPSAPFDPTTVGPLLWAGMGDRLDWMLSRSVVMELHISRLQHALQGETSQERFIGFINQLSSPLKALAFFQEYTVLARIVIDTLDLWEETSRELLWRLCRDWEEILATFHCTARPGMLTAVTGSLGDLHCRGRCVRILSFQSGFRLVYKPRPVAIYARFAELLTWLNERGAPGLAAALVLEREGYGWMDYISNQPCTTRAELMRFYLRQGAFLALFYVLNATDLHRENLIASGEHPMFVDLECLLTPNYGQFEPQAYDSLAHFDMDHSVTRVMMLPFFHEKSKEVVDPSGLGGEGGQLSVYEIPVWKNSGTDEMRLEKVRTPVSQASNRPTLNGVAVNPLDFREALEDGFVSTYRLLMSYREELLGVGSPLARSSEAEVRIVFRASQLYSFILEESYHPDLLRDAVDRDRHFDRLWFGIDRSKLSEISLQILPMEREDLWRGDIPYFYTRAGSQDVWGSCGQHLRDMLTHSGLDMAERRLRRLGEEDLNKQLWYIRGALTALSIELQSTPPPPNTQLARTAPYRDGVLAVAASISERLTELALRDGCQAAWIGLAKTRARGWWLRPLGADLYSGLPGIALYLAHSGEVFGEPEHTLLAREALINLDRQLERRKRVTTVGGFDGWGGLVHTWLHLGRLWQDDGLVQKAIDILPKIAELIDLDEDMDIVRGCAGGIIPLLALYREANCEVALCLARRMGDHLVAKALTYKQTLYWQTASFPVHPLTGFSHGNSGMAWALLELYATTGIRSYLETAARAVAFEREFFSPEEGNWMDLRSVHADLGTFDYTQYKKFNVAWCHGAVGIGLSRLRMLPYLGTAEMLSDVRAAAEKLLQRGFGINHCLCHGDLGNLELIVEVSRILNDPRWGDAATKITQRVLVSIEERGFLCGVPYFVETPGLMDGLAGIGYGLLRLAEPKRVPSILMLDLPS